LAEWWIEDGIGEWRAALIDDETIIEARVIPEGELITGTIVEARLVARMPERNEGVVAWDSSEAVIAPLPKSITEGARTLVEIVRPALPEPGKPKRARARPASPGTTPLIPDPAAALSGTVRTWRIGQPDALEGAGWSALLEEARTCTSTFPGGALALFPTPAMTLIDIDGTLPAAELAVPGARAAAKAVRRLDVGGSIGIDLPDAGDRTARAAAAGAIDAVLPQPFERTAVNGFGFVQIVRRRARRSLIEVLGGDGPLAAARALLRQAEHTPGAGTRTLTAHPSVIAELTARPAWMAELARRIGAGTALRPDPQRPIWPGHVQADHA
jgi:hypothetical protein